MMNIRKIFGRDVFSYNSNKHNNLDFQQPVVVNFASLSPDRATYDVDTPDVIHMTVWRCYNLVLKRYRGTEYRVRYIDWVKPQGPKPAVPSEEMMLALENALEPLGVLVTGIDPDVTFMTYGERAGSLPVSDHLHPDVATSVYFYQTDADLDLKAVIEDIEKNVRPKAWDVATRQGSSGRAPTKLVQVVEDSRPEYHGARVRAMRFLAEQGWAMPVLKSKMYQHRTYLLQDAIQHLRPLSELIRPRVWKSLPDDVANTCCRSLLQLSVFFETNHQIEYIPSGFDQFLHDLVVDTTTGQVMLWNLAHVVYTLDGTRYAFGYSSSVAPAVDRKSRCASVESNVRQAMTELLKNNLVSTW